MWKNNTDCKYSSIDVDNLDNNNDNVKCRYFTDNEELPSSLATLPFADCTQESCPVSNPEKVLAALGFFGANL